MSIDSLTHEEVKERYKLLAKATQRESNVDYRLRTKLNELDKQINQDLVALTRQGAPDNITDILREFNNELVRFKRFCELPDLATKSVIGIGGGFSAGKSSFINQLIGQKRLVVEVDPTTSMPCYVLKGEEESILALNLRDRAIALSQEQFSSLTHDELNLYGSQVGSLLQSAFLSLPDFAWDNLAILDTPGYSKPEDSSWNERTDENLARSQLNSADYIIWVVPADNGTISEEDIQFLSSINRDIPKLIVLSKADKREPDDLIAITELVKTTLKGRGITILDVVPYSRRKKANYSLDEVTKVFGVWNQSQKSVQFAQNFKHQFLAYQRFIEDEQRHVNARLHKINRILAMSEVEEITEDANDLQAFVLSSSELLEKLSDSLAELRQAFFSKLNEAGKLAGIDLPEPNALELMEIESINLLDMLLEIKEESGLSADLKVNGKLKGIYSQKVDQAVIEKMIRREKCVSKELTEIYNHKISGDFNSELSNLISVDTLLIGNMQHE